MTSRDQLLFRESFDKIPLGMYAKLQYGHLRASSGEQLDLPKLTLLIIDHALVHGVIMELEAINNGSITKKSQPPCALRYLNSLVDLVTDLTILLVGAYLQ